MRVGVEVLVVEIIGALVGGGVVIVTLAVIEVVVGVG